MKIGKYYLIKHKIFPFNKIVFAKYFHEHNWTLKTYAAAVEHYLTISQHDLRKNEVYLKERSLRRCLENGRIPLDAAIKLCKFFNCMPSEIGIDVK